MHHSLIFMKHRLRSGGVLPAGGARGTRSLNTRKGLQYTPSLIILSYFAPKKQPKNWRPGAGPRWAITGIGPRYQAAASQSQPPCSRRWPQRQIYSIPGPGLPAGHRDNRLKEQGKSSRILPVNFSTTANLNLVIFLLFQQIWIIDKLISRESARIVVTAS